MRYNRIIWLMALFMSAVMSWGQVSLIDNGNGTWRLAAMPGYDVDVLVEYEDLTPEEDIELIAGGNGTWRLAAMPAYDVDVLVEYEDISPEEGIELIDNGDGTWSLAAMPGYDVDVLVEYEDDDSPRNVYTEFAEETGTLTYYYDGLMDSRSGITELYDPVNDPEAVRFTDYYRRVTRAVIDKSMAMAPLTSTRDMFFGGTNPETWVMQSLSKMESIEGLENLNTENVTDMCNMFSMCQSLKMLDLSTFNTSNVTKMVAMFQLCEKLEIVDVSSFDISKVTDLGQMFNYCPSLKTICCFTDWSTTTATSDFMFSNCTSLVGGNGTVFDKNFRDATYARPDGGTASPGYFTAETMTGIRDLKDSKNLKVYNLSGQRLSKPAKGINIVGGKKVLVK